MDSLCVRTLVRLAIGIPFAMVAKTPLDPKSVNRGWGPPCQLGGCAWITAHSEAVAFPPDGERFAAGDANGFVRIWDLPPRTIQ